MIFGQCQETSNTAPRVKLYSPREESFPIPLKYIDVSRTTQTNLDVMQESHIDDFWIIDRSRDLSDSWTGFTQFTLLDEKPPDGYMWSGRRLTKRQVTSRPPDHLWPELWTKLGRNAKLRERQKLSIEKPKLDNARRLRGIYFIDPEDKEFKEIIRSARKKLETPMAPVMPCKTCKKSKNGETRSKTDDFKSKFACKLEASESTRMQMEESLEKYHEGHIAGNGDNSLQHYNLVHKFIPMPQAMKIPAAKAAVDKEWEKLDKIPAWQMTKVRNKKRGDRWSNDEGRKKVHFASLMDICHLKNAELETKHQNYKGRVVLRGDIVKDDSGLYAVFTEQGSSDLKWRQRKSWISYPHCQDAQEKQRTQYLLIPLVKKEDAPKLMKIPNQNVQTFGFVYHDTHGQNHGPVWKTQSFLLSEICTVILWQDWYGKGNLRTSCWNTVGRKFPIGNACSYTMKKGYSYLCMWMTSNWLERNKIFSDVERTKQRSWFGRTNIIPRSCIPGMHSKTMWNKQRYCWQLQNHVWITNFRRSNWKITMLGRSEYLFVVLWHGRSCQEMCGKMLWVG